MTDKKWTPGPWTWDSEGGDWPGEWLEGTTDTVLHWDFDMGFQFGSEGDKTLIAAAPDLYDALEYVYENGDGENSRAMMKAALAKARGEV